LDFPITREELTAARKQAGYVPLDKQSVRGTVTPKKPTLIATESVEEPEDNNWLTGQEYVYNNESDSYYTYLRAAGDTIQVSGEVHRQMKDAYSNMTTKGSTINEICRDFGMPRAWFDEYRRRHGWTHDMDPFTDEEVAATPHVDQLVDDLVLRRRQALHKKHEARKWKDVEASAMKWDSFEDTVLNTFKGMLSEFENDPPELVEMPDNDMQYALVVSPTDFHWGKNAWHDETGNTYDFDEAKRRLVATTNDLINRLPARPEKVIIATGSDWFHVDNPKGTTTRGTPMIDIFGSPQQILIAGCKLARQHIEMFRQVAPVEVLFMPGNHDQYSAIALMLYLSAAYESADDVTVDTGPASRQYAVYGKTLMGFTHGDKVKLQKLPQLMAIEQSENWGNTSCRLWFTGHYHHQTVQEMGGAICIILPSLSGTDKWHFDHGYVGARAGLMGHLVDIDAGLVGNLFCPVQIPDTSSA
jgi:predicted phosphodiesterase